MCATPRTLGRVCFWAIDELQKKTANNIKQDIRFIRESSYFLM